jgi:peptide/nickel transport system ATP-binding protein
MSVVDPPQELLKVVNFSQAFKMRGASLEAVSDVSFELRRGETLGLVGESGCGKSSLARGLLQLPRPTSGVVEFDGEDLTQLSGTQLRSVRRRMQMIFQDPAGALNPRRRVRDIAAEGMVIAGESKPDARRRASEALGVVGLDPQLFGDKRPGELSGGQCQRVAIARALVIEPELLICDEPVASLDVSIQGQVLNLLEDLRARTGLAMLFISHDLAVVHNVSDRIAVMYLGKLVELGPASVVTRRPAHPYTRALIDAVPEVNVDRIARTEPLSGEVPSPLAPPSGCRFRTRCTRAQDVCAVEVPPLRPIDGSRIAACHFPLTNSDGPADAHAPSRSTPTEAM